MRESVRERLVVVVCAALAVCTLAVYWQVRGFDFVNFDDDKYITANPHVLEGLTSQGVIWAFTTGYAAFWHPLTWLSLMLDGQLFGRDPGWFHLTNVLLHVANTLLLLLVLWRMTRALWPSAFVAAAFALHPMHVESVAWVAERKDVLSTLFLLLTLLAYSGYVRRPSAGRYLLVIMAFVVGLMAKPMLVTVPFLLLLLDYWPLGRFSSHDTSIAYQGQSLSWEHIRSRYAVPFRIVVEKMPFVVLAIAFSALVVFTQRSAGGVAANSDTSLNDRVANALVSYVRYAGKLLWPDNLAAYYPYDAHMIRFWQAAVCAILLVGLSVAAIWFGYRRKYLITGWFWFLITLLPVIGLIRFTGASYADRFTYVPYTGLFILAAWGAPELLSRLPHRRYVLIALSAIVLGAFAVCSHKQAAYWKDTITLFSHAIEVTQGNDIAHNNRGVAYGNMGLWDKSLSDYNEAIRIKPSAEFYNNRSVAYDNLGRWQDSLSDCDKAIELDPGFAVAYINRGVTYSRLGQWENAAAEFRRALALDPDSVAARADLDIATNALAGRSGPGAAASGLARSAAVPLGAAGRSEVNRPSTRDLNATLRRLQDSIRLQPDNVASLNELALLMVRYPELAGRDANEAVRLAGRACDLTENRNATYLCTLSRACSAAGKRGGAIEAARSAVVADPDLALAHRTLGAALLAVGDFAPAIRSIRRSLELDPSSASARNNLAWMLATSPDPNLRDSSEAIRLARQACDMAGNGDASVLDTLAAAYASAGRYGEATAAAEKALGLAEAADQPGVADAIRLRLSLYKQGKPWVESLAAVPSDASRR